jgi:hypothetical protein
MRSIKLIGIAAGIFILAAFPAYLAFQPRIMAYENKLSQRARDEDEREFMKRFQGKTPLQYYHDSLMEDIEEHGKLERGLVKEFFARAGAGHKEVRPFPQAGARDYFFWDSPLQRYGIMVRYDCCLMRDTEFLSRASLDNGGVSDDHPRLLLHPSIGGHLGTVLLLRNAGLSLAAPALIWMITLLVLGLRFRAYLANRAKPWQDRNSSQSKHEASNARIVNFQWEVFGPWIKGVAAIILAALSVYATWKTYDFYQYQKCMQARKALIAVIGEGELPLQNYYSYENLKNYVTIGLRNGQDELPLYCPSGGDFYRGEGGAIFCTKHPDREDFISTLFRWGLPHEEQHPDPLAE